MQQQLTDYKNDLKLLFLKNLICAFFEELEKQEKLRNADYNGIKIHEILERIMFIDLDKFNNLWYKDSVLKSVTDKLEYMLEVLENK